MSSAVISSCGQFRMRLDRKASGRQGLMLEPDHPLKGKVIAFFGVNPSTADAAINDATVLTLIGFCNAWGAERFIIGNVFSFRAKDVNRLREVPDPVGPDNHAHLRQIADEADVLVPCWGARAKVPSQVRHHFDATLELLRATGKPVLCFGLTQSGDPRHPLYMPHETELVAVP